MEGNKLQLLKVWLLESGLDKTLAPLLMPNVTLGMFLTSLSVGFLILK